MSCSLDSSLGANSTHSFGIYMSLYFCDNVTPTAHTRQFLRVSFYSVVFDTSSLPSHIDLYILVIPPKEATECSLAIATCGTNHQSVESFVDMPIINEAYDPYLILCKFITAINLSKVHQSRPFDTLFLSTILHSVVDGTIQHNLLIWFLRGRENAIDDMFSC
jgi:hypothetical protein